ncbi:MAG: hypothetical protein ACRCXT_20120, partial [Paraclostridium sp.]
RTEVLHMKNIIIKTPVISTIIIFTVSMLSGCNVNEGITDINNQEKIISEIGTELNKDNTKVLKIEKSEVINQTKDVNKNIETQTKITNISDFNISDISLIYREFDKDNNSLSTTESFMELTLKPNDIAYIPATHKKYARSAEVIKYSYVIEGQLVNVDLDEDTFNITNLNEEKVRRDEYDILAISSPQEMGKVRGGYNSKVTIKNLSDGDIGVVSILLGELNENNEYIGVSYLDSYEVMKESQSIELDSVHSDKVKSLEILGYRYDDVRENESIYVNLKLSQARSIKYK